MIEDAKQLGKLVFDFELKGKMYKFTPITLNDFFELELHLRKTAIEMFKATVDEDAKRIPCPVCKGEGSRLEEIDNGDKGKIKERVKCFICNGLGSRNVYLDTLIGLAKKPIPFEEVINNMDSVAGMRFMLWRSILKHQEKMTIEQVNDMVDSSNLRYIQEILTTLSNLGEQEKNLSKVETKKKEVKIN